MTQSVVLRNILFSVFCFAYTAATAQPAITPTPERYMAGKGMVQLSLPVHISTEGQQEGNDFNAAYLGKELGMRDIASLRIIGKTPSGPKQPTSNIILQVSDSSSSERYRILASGNTIRISGSARSVFYGIQSLLQLLPYEKNKNGIRLPAFSINDQPRFSYRGMHLDVARHFFTVPEVKKYIDYLAFHKYNRFHWHLTDDQGWRIEIRKYPGLTSVGGWRNGTIIGRYPGSGNTNTRYGGFYTREEIKEVVQYAAQRYITIVPEIEMPGHSSAAIAAYPQLSCFPEEPTVIPGKWVSESGRKAGGKLVQETWGVFEDVFAPTDYTFHFLEDVLDEVMALFPSTYIHIGGDECPKEAWKRSAFCQQLIKEKHLQDEHGLQSYFIQRIEKYLNGKGRKIIGWDEILEGGLAPNASVMSWRGEEGGITAAQQRHTVVMTPGSHCYFDHSQSRQEDSVTIGGYTSVEKVYAYEPLPAVLTPQEARYVLGAQGNVWTEYITNMSKLEYMIFPRLSALSEVLWTPKAKRNWPSFGRRIPTLVRQYQDWEAHYSLAYFEPGTTVIPAPVKPGIVWRITNKLKDQSVQLIDPDGKKELISMADSTACNLAISRPGNYTVQLLSIYKGSPRRNIAKVLSTVSQSFSFNKATGKPIQLATAPSGKYPGDGAFTLVNAVQNKMGFARSAEFLGFEGTDGVAVIDLGTTTAISKVLVHALHEPSNWIWSPKAVTVYTSADSVHFTKAASTDQFINTGNANGVMTVGFPAVQARYVKLVIENHGNIPPGHPGAGNPAWLFVDEVEIE